MPFHHLAALLCAAVAPAQSTQTVLRQHFGTQFDQYYAESVTWMGDVNRDGVDDYVIGGSRYANSQGEVGIVQMISGATRGVLYSVSSGSPGSRFGFSLTWIGDQDGDRVREWVVGAPFDGTRGTGAGRAYCFSGATGRLLVRPSGTEPLVRVMAEAPDQSIADAAVARIVEALGAVH